VSTFLEDDKDNIPDEYLECLQGCNPNNYYEVVEVEINFLKDTNATHSTAGTQAQVPQSNVVGVSESVCHA